MLDEAFKWDDAKAASNWREHGIFFAMAREAFNDEFAIERMDSNHDDREERHALLGMVENHVLFVSYTLRGERIRIISARKPEPNERRKYHNENGKA
jgi:uncharacterized DUF497 family protein